MAKKYFCRSNKKTCGLMGLGDIFVFLMRKASFSFLFVVAWLCCYAQKPANKRITITVLNENGAPLVGTTVSLLRPDSSLLRTDVTDSSGNAEFANIGPGMYMIAVTNAAYQGVYVANVDLMGKEFFQSTIQLKPGEGALENVTVVARKPFLQFFSDKTVVNVDASITNAGATVLEVLEKSPGITVDRDGNISMKGRPSVMIMIDGKPTQLAGTDLQNFLNGMSAAQVDVIELIDNPGARYDAAGNAGIINIKTKKNKQRGLNGSISSSYGQGKLPKSNSSFVFNFREGAINTFLTYSLNYNESFVDVYALRRYFDENNVLTSYLDQPFYNRGFNTTQTLRTGIDYFLSDKTTIGLSLTGIDLKRRGRGSSTAVWLDRSGTTDSTIATTLSNASTLRQQGINLNGRHIFREGGELSADFDLINYRLLNNQYFENSLITPGSPVEATTGRIPSTIDIFSGKADYYKRFGDWLWEAGLKSSRVSTDNLAEYKIFDAGNWVNDDSKSNHFLYTEFIHAVYNSLEKKAGRWSIQAGLRYENTSYKARQLGNSIAKDSAFDRNYGSLFPTLFLSLNADSSNQFIFRAGRRIDRPAFQKLNPFVIILNKYTLQQGNPYFNPQFTWNLELSHVYKEFLTTSLTYNYTKDYFSQLFYSDTSTGMITYTEGNAGSMKNLGISVSIHADITKWWSLSATAVLNHKKIEGLLYKQISSSITQGNLSFNNQFKIAKNWNAELSGFYISGNQNDLQEVLTHTGQLSTGLSHIAFKGKGTFRLTVRDIFYSQAMAGWTYFEAVDEYFKLLRDTRVATFGFIYRFGKAMKQPKRTGGGAVDETNRVGTGN